MLSSQGCIVLFVLYISGIHTIPKPLDTVDINLNIDDSHPTPSRTHPRTPFPTASGLADSGVGVASSDPVTAGGASLGGEESQEHWNHKNKGKLRKSF